MSKFDLFQLHRKEDEYGSMSYIIVKGKNLGKIVIDLVLKIVRKRKINKKILLQEISNKIGLSYYTIEKQISKLKNYDYWISLAFLEELVNEYRICFPCENIDYIKDLLIGSFEKIKISNGKSLELNAVKELSKDLCVLAGAHAADGCLYKKKTRLHYQYKVFVVDREYKAVECYKDCLYNLFGLKTKIYKLEGCWMVCICNKIIFRYLSLFFGFPIGKKSNIVDEPRIIKHSSFIHRKAFVKGVMTFDGSVTTFGAIMLGVKSKPLIDSVHNVLKRDKIEVTYSFDKKNNVWHLKTSTRLNKDQLNKWLNYFIGGTEKYKRLYDLMNGFRVKPRTINEAIKAFDRKFPRDKRNKISIVDVLKIMIYNKKLFIWDITNKLIKEKNLDSLSYTPVKMYLYVLEKQANIIKSKTKLVKFNRSASKSNLYFLNTFSDWRVP